MTAPLRVLLVTSWQTPCGIAEHSAMLKEAVETADANIDLIPESDALDPADLSIRSLVHDGPGVCGIDIVHLNYQAALHSRWTVERIRELKSSGYKIVTTFHDTGVPNSEQCHAVVDASDVTIVHEPAEDLPAAKIRYWRMGVPDWRLARRVVRTTRPLLGTIGFPFGWKNYDELCRLTARAGWDLLLITPKATPEDVARWRSLHPRVFTRTTFVSRPAAISALAGCDATAFTYVCHNTGQSGAILLGIAARKPVIALSTCRQFRALYADPLGRDAIYWRETFDQVEETLHHLPIQRVDPTVVALAEQESWTHLGKKYAQLYRELLGG